MTTAQSTPDATAAQEEHAGTMATKMMMQQTFPLTSENIRLLAKVVAAMKAGLVSEDEMAAVEASGSSKRIMAAAQEWAGRIPTKD